MTRIPATQPSPEGPVYEGRVLHRPNDEVVDQGLSFDVGTLVTRRRVLAFLGAGVSTAVLAACAPTGATGPSGATGSSGSGAAATSDGEIPEETAGPYPGDGSNGADVLEMTGVVRSDIRSSIDGGMTAVGVPMTIALTILDMANDDAPFTDVAVYVWHCDRDGNYSLYSSGLEEETYLRGVQIADSAGVVEFTSIFPACYTGRWPHIHFEVYPDVDAISDSTKAIATSQAALPEDVCDTVYATEGYESSVRTIGEVTLDSDNVFGDDGGALQLATVTGDAASGYHVALTVRVDTGTAAGGGGAAPGGGGPGGGEPPQGGPGGGEPPQGGPGAGEPPADEPPQG